MKLRELLNLLQDVSKKIGSSQPFFCGGTPRDKYMNCLSNISDLDITTGNRTIQYLSEEFYNNIKKNFNITKKTMEDGHSSLFIGNLKMDFSSNFNCPDIDNILKKIGINNPTSMQKEMYSRDFTCNALLWTIDLKELTDPTNHGFEDINDKIIKTCLSPEITLITNKNRVARSIYLATKLDFDVDKSIIDYVAKFPETVKISTEKSLAEKLNKAFIKDPDKASYLVTKMNIWNYIPITEVIYPYYMRHTKNSVTVKNV